jgi:SNF family Na+-dependent transporter
MKKEYLLFIALGAAVVSIVMILISHGFLPRPPWSYDHPAQGWTIYPPFSALPQAIPHREGPTFEEYMAYMGLLVGATIASMVALLFWLIGLFLARFKFGEQTSVWLKILPILLLLPCGIHLVGMGKYFSKEQYEQERSLGEYNPLNPSYSPTDSAALQLLEQDSVDDSMYISK